MPDLPALQALLAETHVLTLATLDPDGAPRATPVFFAADERLDLIFLSDPSSPHSRNLERDPRAAAALYPEVDDWRHIRGLQLRGRVRALESLARQDGLAIFNRRFAFVAQLPEALAGSAVYRFSPGWVRLIDNRRGFGYHQEWRLP